MIKKLILFIVVPVFATTVYVAELDEIINEGTAEYIERCINKANNDKSLLVIEINTYGGLGISMDKIIEDIRNSKTPIVVYVFPSGAHAASAGAFIFMSAHIAVVSPATTIGAAHPVGAGDEISMEKATNLYETKMRGLANERGRNVTCAGAMVRNSTAYTSKEAVLYGIADFEADSLDDLLRKINGSKVNISKTLFEIKLNRYRIERLEMNLSEKVKTIFSNPTIAYLLLVLGFYALVFEFLSPGVGFPGVFGAISLIIALWALGTFKTSTAGIILTIIGISLLLIEAMTPSFGIIGLGGIVALLVGSTLLITEPFIQISLKVVMALIVGMTAFFFFAMYRVLKARKLKVISGKERLIGQEATVVTDIVNGHGQVKVRGEIWNVESKEDIPSGEKVEIKGIKGLTFIVERKHI
jgi:membrane-bound serine protease (ClpP class)